ncbi:MAG TPA: GNAT family N-acetyltransferase [Candidatus Dormibacteraeota bacterium]|jgi:ribosomal protein S18 acetylase RimI-like enzyme
MRIERLAAGDDVEVRAMLTELALDEQERYDHPRLSAEEVAGGTALPRHHFTGENHLLVARDQAGAAAGLCWCVLFDPGTGLEGEVAELYVRPEARGRGVASALLRDAMALFRRRQVTFACVWTRDDNPAALAAYRSAGFTPTEQAVLTWLPLPGR